MFEKYFEVSVRTSSALAAALLKQQKNTMFGLAADMINCIGCPDAPVCPDCKLPPELRFKDWEKQHDEDIPFDFTCPGPRFEDSPEGDCEHCDYCVNGYCTLQEEPDEPTGEDDEIDPYVDTESSYPIKYEKTARFIEYNNAVGWPLTYRIEAAQEFLDEDGDPIFVLEYLPNGRVDPDFPGDSGVYVHRLGEANGVPVFLVEVAVEVWEDDGLALVMDDALDKLKVPTGHWCYVEKMEVINNEKN